METYNELSPQELKKGKHNCPHCSRPLNGDIKIYKKAWVFSSKVILIDHDYIDVSVVIPEWKTEYAHYVNDFIPVQPALV